MEFLDFENGTYKTKMGKVSMIANLMPSLAFYRKLLSIVFKASANVKRLKYDTAEWSRSSFDVLSALENVGVKVEITGVDYFKDMGGPCVFIANHMSTLETFVLPTIIAPFKDVTFVVKKSLVEYPVFKYVMRSRDPVVVGRTNPRDDLRAVMKKGTEILKAGRSIIIFPQATRYQDIDPKKFNTIGIKLAHRANVPVVPIALKTDAWGNGKYLNDFGKIDPSRKVYFAFGEPMLIKDRGDEEHHKIIKFISGKLKEWGN